MDGRPSSFRGSAGHRVVYAAGLMAASYRPPFPVEADPVAGAALTAETAARVLADASKQDAATAATDAEVAAVVAAALAVIDGGSP